MKGLDNFGHIVLKYVVRIRVSPRMNYSFVSSGCCCSFLTQFADVAVSRLRKLKKKEIVRNMKTQNI